MRLKLYRGSWYAVGREGGKTVRRALRTKDRAVAERRLADLRRQEPGALIGDIVPAYIVDKEAQGRASTEAMRYAWKALAPVFAPLRPDQVTREACRLYARRRRRAGRSDGTVIKELGVLKAALGWAGRADKARIELPAAPAPRDRCLTKAEVDRLIAAPDQAHIALFILLAYSTGARASAALDLTWDRVDFDRGIVRLARGGERGKGRATVPMTKRLQAALAGARTAAISDHVVEWAGAPVKSVKRGFARAVALAGLDGVTPHVLRHSAAVHMVEAGRPIEEVAQFLGHSNPAVTFRVYARYSPLHLRQAAAALE